MFACTKGGNPSGTASGYAGKISLSLCSCRITIYFVEHSILPGNHYTCSSYVARVLEEYGVCHWEKHFSLVTPKDFMEKFGRKRIFEGSLRELVEMSVQEETVCAVEKIA